MSGLAPCMERGVGWCLVVGQGCIVVEGACRHHTPVPRANAASRWCTEAEHRLATMQGLATCCRACRRCRAANTPRAPDAG